MARAIGRLTVLKVEKAKKPGMYADGGGLYLRVTPGRLNQPLDFSLGQVLAGPIGGVGLAHRQSNCAFFGGWTDHFEVVDCRHFPLPRLMTANISLLLQPVDQEKLPAPMSHFDSPAEAPALAFGCQHRVEKKIKA